MGRPGALGVHDIRTRSSGSDLFIQFHLDMNGAITINGAHEISKAVMYQVEEVFPRAQVLIHEEPAGIVKQRKKFT